MTEKERFKYTICTLYRNHALYERLQGQLGQNGYLKEVEFLPLDNSINAWECYSAIRYFLEKAQGEYVIICHEDVDLGSLTLRDLDKALTSVNKRDPLAVVFGIAGISRFSHRGCGHFFSKRGEEQWGHADQGRVISLDECFLIIKKNSQVNVSSDLAGFHFYGADLCVNSEKLGLRNYIIDFPIAHESAGTLDESFFQARDRFESHLQDLGWEQVIPTTCTVLYGGKSAWMKGFSLANSYLMVKKSGHQNAPDSMRHVWSQGVKSYGFIKFIFLIFAAEIYFAFRKIRGWFSYLWEWFCVGILFWKVLYPLSWPLRRAWGDLSWWIAKFSKSKNVIER